MSAKVCCSYLLIVITSSYLFSCSEDDGDDFSLVGTNTSIAAISGNWNATKAVFGNTSGPVMETDVVANGGTVSLSIQSNGRFTITVAEQGKPAEIDTGRMGFDEDLLVVSFDDDPEEFEFFGINHIEPNLTITGGNGSAGYDFNGDGVDEPADVDFEFVRI